MINLALSILAGLVVFGIFVGTGLTHALGALLPAILALLGAYVLLARRTGKQLEALVMQSQKELQARRIEKAVEILKSGFPLGRWQFLIEAQLHGQVGQLLYIQKKFDESEPHLKKSFVKVWQARAMLAAQHFRRKEWKEMEEVFDKAVASNKNESLLYAVYAWCEDKRGEKKKAIEILTKGVDENKSDEKLKTLLGRAQNDKRLKLDQAYGDQWFQFWLETPPMMQPGGGFGGGFGLRGMRGGPRRSR